MKDRIDLLIELLFDQQASIAERDDAAVDLANFNDPRAISALLACASNKQENELVLNSCGESLGAIWVSQNDFNEQAYHNLSSTSRYGIYYVVDARRPEWVKKYNLDNDEFLD